MHPLAELMPICWLKKLQPEAARHAASSAPSKEPRRAAIAENAGCSELRASVTALCMMPEPIASFWYVPAASRTELAMPRYQNILETIGNTPLVRLNKLAPAGVDVYVKVESFNPLGSVKDRMAHAIIE